MRRSTPSGNMLQVYGVVGNEQAELLMMSVTDDVYGDSVIDSVYEDIYLPTDPFLIMSDPVEPKVLETYRWNSANLLERQVNEHGDITRYAYDGDGNRVSMIIDVEHGPNGRGNGNGNGNGKWQDKCDHVVPPGFVPPGLAKKSGQQDEPDTYPIEHPSGPRDGWEHQFKKKHWEFHYTNDVSLALPEPIQITEEDPTKWKETFVYGAGGERISYTYLPAYDANNGWEPTPGVGGAEPGVTPKTLWYMIDALGSTLGMLEADGRVSSRYHYDEFGVVLDAKKYDPNWPGPDNLYGYTGLGYDYYSELTYARARYYNPEIGRFSYKGDIVNPQSQNLYAYVHNNPVFCFLRGKLKNMGISKKSA